MRFREFLSENTEYAAWHMPVIVVLVVGLSLFIGLAAKGHRVTLPIVSCALLLFLRIVLLLWVYILALKSDAISVSVQRTAGILFSVGHLSCHVMMIVAFVNTCRGTDQSASEGVEQGRRLKQLMAEIKKGSK